jgi:holo-[acyl-carrier protein] synthase
MPDIVGIGSDVTECLRIARMIDRYGDLFINRVFTPEEVRFCRGRRQATQHFAGRWAAKEAILRALGTTWRRGIAWHDLEIRADAVGATTARLYGGARQLAERLGVSTLLVSISQCHTHATAMVIALGARKEGEAPRDRETGGES